MRKHSLNIAPHLVKVLMLLTFLPCMQNAEAKPKKVAIPKIYKIYVNNQYQEGFILDDIHGFFTSLDIFCKTYYSPGENFANYAVTKIMDYDGNVIYTENMPSKSRVGNLHVCAVDLKRNIAFIPFKKDQFDQKLLSSFAIGDTTDSHEYGYTLAETDNQRKLRITSPIQNINKWAKLCNYEFTDTIPYQFYKNTPVISQKSIIISNGFNWAKYISGTPVLDHNHKAIAIIVGGLIGNEKFAVRLDTSGFSSLALTPSLNEDLKKINRSYRRFEDLFILRELDILRKKKINPIPSNIRRLKPLFPEIFTIESIPFGISQFIKAKSMNYWPMHYIIDAIDSNGTDMRKEKYLKVKRRVKRKYWKYQSLQLLYACDNYYISTQKIGSDKKKERYEKAYKSIIYVHNKRLLGEPLKNSEIIAWRMAGLDFGKIADSMYKVILADTICQRTIEEAKKNFSNNNFSTASYYINKLTKCKCSGNFYDSIYNAISKNNALYNFYMKAGDKAFKDKKVDSAVIFYKAAHSYALGDSLEPMKKISEIQVFQRKTDSILKSFDNKIISDHAYLKPLFLVSEQSANKQLSTPQVSNNDLTPVDSSKIMTWLNRTIVSEFEQDNNRVGMPQIKNKSILKHDTLELDLYFGLSSDDALDINADLQYYNYPPGKYRYDQCENITPFLKNILQRIQEKIGESIDSESISIVYVGYADALHLNKLPYEESDFKNINGYLVKYQCLYSNDGVPDCTSGSRLGIFKKLVRIKSSDTQNYCLAFLRALFIKEAFEGESAYLDKNNSRIYVCLSNRVSKFDRRVEFKCEMKFDVKTIKPQINNLDTN